MNSLGPDSIVVLHRRESKLPIEIPWPLPEVDHDQEAPGLKGTTPLGRELIRKQIFVFRQKLAERGIKLKKAEVKEPQARAAKSL